MTLDHSRYKCPIVLTYVRPIESLCSVSIFGVRVPILNFYASPAVQNGRGLCPENPFSRVPSNHTVLMDSIISNCMRAFFTVSGPRR